MRTVTVSVTVADPSDIFAYGDPEGFLLAISDPLARSGLVKLFAGLKKSAAMLADGVTPVDTDKRAVQYLLQQIANS